MSEKKPTTNLFSKERVNEDTELHNDFFFERKGEGRPSLRAIEALFRQVDRRMDVQTTHTNRRTDERTESARLRSIAVRRVHEDVLGVHVPAARSAGI